MPRVPIHQRVTAAEKAWRQGLGLVHRRVNDFLQSQYPNGKAPRLAPAARKVRRILDYLYDAFDESLTSDLRYRIPPTVPLGWIKTDKPPRVMRAALKAKDGLYVPGRSSLLKLDEFVFSAEMSLRDGRRVHPWCVGTHALGTWTHLDEELDEQISQLAALRLSPSWMTDNVVEPMQAHQSIWESLFGIWRAVFGPTHARDPATKFRDAWIYKQCMKGTAYKVIILSLKEKPRWTPIDSVQGIRAAAQRHADADGLPPPPKRQGGRPRKSKT